MNIQDLINQIKAATTNNTDGNVTININLNQPVVDSVDNDPVVVDDTPDTDFDVDDRVVVCHTRHNGDIIHTMGTVIEVLGEDDNGWYTRVLGDNGKHYRTGLKYNEERLGSFIVKFEED